MMAIISHLALQQYWWILVSVLGSLLVFLLFVQGGQTLLFTLAKTEIERSILVNSLGRKWELTFTTLVTFGGAFFASFPLFYSTSFGGAYWVWMFILFAFVLQAVSYEYRKKAGNLLGQRSYEIFLFINGTLGTILLGTAVATFFSGSSFYINEFHFSEWKSPWRGLEAAVNLHNLSLGLAVFFLSRVLAILYFMNNVRNTEIINRAKTQLIYNSIPFVVFFLLFIIRLMFINGVGYNPDTGAASLVSYKYWHNIKEMPVNTVILLLGVLFVLFGIFRVITCFNTCSDKGIWICGIGTFLTVFSLFILAGFNQTSFYPSVFDIQSSLTIQNSSSSVYTLKAMSIVSLLIPFVLAYIVYVWYQIDRKKIDAEEIASEEHVY